MWNSEHHQDGYRPQLLRRLAAPLRVTATRPRQSVAKSGVGSCTPLPRHAPDLCGDPEHPRIEDLKRKDHVATCVFDEEEITQPGFIDYFADACRTASPYMEFLTQAVGLPY